MRILLTMIGGFVLAGVVVYSQSKEPLGDSGTIRLDSFESQIIRPSNYWYSPQKDITPYELARLVPLFSGPSYGMGQWSTRGAVVPAKDRQQPGCPVNGTLLALVDDQIKDLGAAARHLKKCP